MALSADAAQLDTAFANFLTALAAADTANTALQGAVADIGPLRDTATSTAQAARVAYNNFLRQVGTGSMTAQQRQQFRRIFGDLDDLNPGQLGNAVRLAAGG